VIEVSAVDGLVAPFSHARDCRRAPGEAVALSSEMEQNHPMVSVYAVAVAAAAAAVSAVELVSGSDVIVAWYFHGSQSAGD